MGFYRSYGSLCHADMFAAVLSEVLGGGPVVSVPRGGYVSREKARHAGCCRAENTRLNIPLQMIRVALLCRYEHEWRSEVRPLQGDE